MNTNLTTDQTLTQDALILEIKNRKILQPSSCISGACCQVGPGSRVRYYAITATSLKVTHGSTTNTESLGFVLMKNAKKHDLHEWHHSGAQSLSAERGNCPPPSCTVYLLGW